MDMREDSPAPFVVFRAPVAPKQDPYDKALVLVGVVHQIVGTASTRFYLKDRLDRAATGLVFELGRAASAVSTLRWRNYRAAQTHAADVATVLDILVHQNAAAANDLERARALIRELNAELATRSRG